MEDEADPSLAERRVRQPVPTAPAEGSLAGPSRLGMSNEARCTSKFHPLNGINLVSVSEADLLSAGCSEDVPGPGVIISLGPSECLLLAGIFNITPLQLPLSIFSTTLYPASDSRSADTYPVFAPTSHPIPVIAPIASEQIQPARVSSQLNSLAMPSTFALQEQGSGPFRTVFLIREHRCGLDGLRGGAVPGFTSIWLDDRGFGGLRGVHAVVGSFPAPVYPYITPPSWDAGLSLLDRPSASLEDEASDTLRPLVALVKGAKRSGKSTFGRAAMNRLLERYERVAWLECDVGQGEFGCGGVVGIWVLDRPVLGPSFTHLAIPRRAHYLGTYSPLTCPDEYLAAIRHLFDFYRYELQYPTDRGSCSKISDVIPLVINTQGWVKGLGEDLLRAIERMAEPSHVFTFSSVAEDSEMFEEGGWTNSPPRQHGERFASFGAGSTPSGPAIQHCLESAPISPLQARYTPADFRTLSIICYFHAMSLSSSDRLTWDFSKALLSIAPIQMELGSTIEQVVLIGEGSEGVIEEDLPLALNGSVVAFLELEDAEGPVYEQGRPYPRLDDSNFLCFALIRSLRSMGTMLTMQLLTPVPASRLGKVRAIVKNGAIELPLCGLLDWRDGAVTAESLAGTSWEDVPYMDVGRVEVVGGERRRFRRNLMRKGM